MKKTALQEAIDKVEKLQKADYVINSLGMVKDILNDLLPKEREDLEEAYNVGYRLDLPTGTYGKHYYEQTFEQ
jgi:hypothetical protein